MNGVTRKSWLLLSLLIAQLGLYADGGGGPERAYQLNIFKAQEALKIDGVLNESAWARAEIADSFYQQFPFDTAYTRTRTEVMVTFDENFLYIGARCYDPDPGNYIVQSLKRDFSYPVTDAFAVYIDPFNDGTNGFSFAVSPLGVQREGLLENGGDFGVSTQWDNRWYSAVKEYDDRWEVEMAIPFKTLRFNQDSNIWRINFSRNNQKENEGGSWVPVPRNFNVANLAYTGELIWETPPRKPRGNISVIPYGLAGHYADYEAGDKRNSLNAGMDAKVAVSSSLNLDLTVNPDFSQVEVDRQVTNLDRFSLFFPERRQFFIENNDLFGNFGFRQIRPFFSRRIGLSDGQAVPILGGARLSGKLNRNWRIGLMDMQTEGGTPVGEPAQNFAVAAVQRRVFARSNLAFIFVNRQAFGANNRPDPEDFNRVMGLDYNHASADNKLRAKLFYHYSLDGESRRHRAANAAWVMYNTRKLTLHYNHEFVERNYNAEVGFVRRSAYLRFEPIGEYRFFPKKGPILAHGPNAYASIYYNNVDWFLTDRQIRLGYGVDFANRSTLELNAESWYIWLADPFDPSRTGAAPLADSTGYDWRTLRLTYSSDVRKKLNGSFYAETGGYFNGKRTNFGGELNFRTQPWGIFSLAVDQNFISLPDTSVSLTLIGPRFELSFTRSLFLTTFFQYNTQLQNFNINARMQWRFRPMSDLFLVLTDNYATPYMDVRNRAIVLKLVWWLSV